MKLLNGIDGALGEIRTPDPRIRSPMLYPAELRAHQWFQRVRGMFKLSALTPALKIIRCKMFGALDYQSLWRRATVQRSMYETVFAVFTNFVSMENSPLGD
jgi:hypothetical protein